MKKERLLSGFVGAGIACTISGITMIAISTNMTPVSLKESSPAPQETVEIVKEVIKEVPVELTDTEIKSKAVELGMILVNNESERIVTLRTINLTEANSIEISKRLEKEGIIDDATKFQEYVKEKEKTKLLQTGTKEFKVNSTYAEALNVLLNIR